MNQPTLVSGPMTFRNMVVVAGKRGVVWVQPYELEDIMDNLPVYPAGLEFFLN